jgi:hypothetical protein
MHAIKILNALEKAQTLPKQQIEKLRNHEFEKWEVDKIKIWFNSPGVVRACNVAAEMHLGCSFVERNEYHISQFLPELRGFNYIQLDKLHPNLQKLADDQGYNTRFYCVERRPNTGRLFL